MYTDEQLKRVAEWLGVDITFWDYGDKTVAVTDPDSYHTYIHWVDYQSWLLSPEGRCTIEDKFIEAEQYMYVDIDHDYPTPPRAPKTYAVFGSADYDDERWGRGDTIAEAWLDTAVKYTEAE